MANTKKHRRRSKSKTGKAGLKSMNSSKKPSCNLEGSRIINLKAISNNYEKVIQHAKSCPTNSIPKMSSEVEKQGLASTLLYECDCGITIAVKTHDDKNSTGHHDINVAMVWGAMSTGAGYSNVDEIMSVCNIPNMSEYMYLNLEKDIGHFWEKELLEEVLEAGKAEKNLAIEQNSYCGGVPAISVIVDGGWSMRSNGHRYSAKSGVAVIIGDRTKKILFLGVKNKYCSICSVAQHKGKDAKLHQCYKNWVQSSSSMEPALIAEGFCESETMHGLRYIYIIGDGDSSVHKTVISQCSYGHLVHKLECANHAIRCYRKKMHELVDSNPQWKGKGGLTQKKIKQITAGARAAIRMHSTSKDVQQLQKDIRNGPYHVFGSHENCNIQFCKTRQEANINCHTPCEDMIDNDVDNEPTAVAEQTVCNLNSDPESPTQFEKIIQEIRQDLIDDPIISEVEVSFGNEKSNLKTMPLGLMPEILKCSDRLIAITPQLISNVTSNAAENFMSINCKFGGGKQINRTQRGSYKFRAAGAGLSFQNGPKWHEKAWQNCTGKKSGSVLQKYCKKMMKKRERDRTYNSKPERKEKRRKAKYNTGDTLDSSYGPNCDKVDISEQELYNLCQAVEKRLLVTEDEAKRIEIETRGQNENPLWHKIRKERITSSQFGTVCKRRSTTARAPLVKSLLYPSFRGNKSTAHGIQCEKFAKDKYEEVTSNKVSPCGIFIYLKNGYFATSPDGIVTNEHSKGLIEIKCPYNVDDKLPEELCSSKQFCSKLVDGKPKLKSSHNYFYQVQGQLAITRAEWCDFVLWTKSGISIEKIYRDDNFWKNIMEPKLLEFFQVSLLPEIALPMHPHRPIRELKVNSEETQSKNI